MFSCMNMLRYLITNANVRRYYTEVNPQKRGITIPIIGNWYYPKHLNNHRSGNDTGDKTKERAFYVYPLFCLLIRNYRTLFNIYLLLIKRFCNAKSKVINLKGWVAPSAVGSYTASFFIAPTATAENSI
jgi:hypothetical protein